MLTGVVAATDRCARANPIMCALTLYRGKGGALSSCDALLKRVEANDPRLVELVILPMKTFGCADLDRLSDAIGELLPKRGRYFEFAKTRDVHEVSVAAHEHASDADVRSFLSSNQRAERTPTFDRSARPGTTWSRRRCKGSGGR